MKEIQIDPEISEFLNSYTIDYPNEEEMETSIEYILSQVPQKKKRFASFKTSAQTIIANSLREMLMFNWTFWALNSVFLFFGIMSLTVFQTDPYLTLFALAPMPFIAGIFEILKSQHAGLTELEMTLKYNAHQIVSSRLLVVGVFNLFINAAITALCLQVDPGLIFSKLLLSWTIPYVLVSGIAFLIAMSMKSNMVSSVLLTVWFVFCYVMIQTPVTQEFLMQLNGFKAAAFIMAGVIIWIVHIVKIKTFNIRSQGI
ncbi:hypothetical protein [Neobacillus dielmonensis]|uniref:hypothetical protein n=1 Tax=Neobacillus dielmonensis TaxID=1347369 RepID=UPI0005AA6C95|nr:hypothetical protein [Neobacillus dielmonensis]